MPLTPFALSIGHATDHDGGTGCTVVLGDGGPLRAAVHVLGRATGTRELHVLAPDHLVDGVDAILLTGGSAYGLDAAGGVMRWLEHEGRGFPVGAGTVPIVPAAVIFDLAPCGRYDARPTAELGAAAAAAAAAAGPALPAEGSVGAGAGATVGKALGAARATKGGVGVAIRRAEARAAMALVVVNAWGAVRDARGTPIAGPRRPDGALAPAGEWLGSLDPERFAAAAGRSTTLAVVAVDAPMPRVELAALAASAAAALHRRIAPAGTLLDGDVIFAVSPPPAHPAARPAVGAEGSILYGALAVAALEAAVERAVRCARGRDGIPGLADAGAADLPPQEAGL